MQVEQAGGEMKVVEKFGEIQVEETGGGNAGGEDC